MTRTFYLALDVIYCRDWGASSNWYCWRT